MVRLRIAYARCADFLADVEHQVSRRGLLVRVDLGPIERGTPIALEIVTPTGRATVAATVLQPLPGTGVAVELDPSALEPLVEAARRQPAGPGDPPRHERIEEAAAEPPRTLGVPVNETASTAALQAHKIQLALHGDKNQRMAILREQNRMLHGYVLRNPKLQLDEVVFVARMATVSAETLAFIANRREWAERPEVAIALVRNPKTPVPLAVRMLDHVATSELRNLAKLPSVRDAIQRAARKKILG